MHVCLLFKSDLPFEPNTVGLGPTVKWYRRTNCCADDIIYIMLGR